MASEVITKALALIDGAPEQAIASMQRDILAERPSELEAQRGIVAQAPGGGCVKMSRNRMHGGFLWFPVVFASGSGSRFVAGL